MRVLTLLKMSESGLGEPPAEMFTAMDATIKEIDATMTIVDTNGLLPSGVAGTRIVSTGGRSTVLDGPFTESRELVGGYAIVEVDTYAAGGRGVPEDHRGAREVLAGLGGRGRGAPDHGPGRATRRLTACAAAMPPVGIGRVAAAPEVVSAVWRSEAARLVAGLTRMTQDLGLAEDLAQDALVAALEQWPESGRARQPGCLAHGRVEAPRDRPLPAGRAAACARPSLVPEPVMPDLDAAVDHIEDDVLRLMFTACHPVLTTESRVALTLRLVGGLSTREIARAFLSSEATVAQRISRAKRTIAAAGVPFEVPSGPERPERLASVLEVVYLIFNEGYAATNGDDWIRPALSDEALRLGRLLASLTPREPEVHGLLALMQLQASRSAARIGPSGEAVLLRDQDRGRWDRDLIAAGLESLRRAGRGPYGLQAAIAACHAVAPSVEETDWVRIASLYPSWLWSPGRRWSS